MLDISIYISKTNRHEYKNDTVKEDQNLAYPHI